MARRHARGGWTTMVRRLFDPHEEVARQPQPPGPESAEQEEVAPEPPRAKVRRLSPAAPVERPAAPHAVEAPTPAAPVEEPLGAAVLRPLKPAPPEPRVDPEAARRAARRREWRLDTLAVAALVALALAVTWPLALHPASTLPDLGDPIDSAWRLSWPVHQLLRDPRHLLDANIYYPIRTTYLFDELILGVALVVAPVTLLTGNGALSFNVGLILAFALNGVGMYFLTRRLTGSRWAGLAAGVVFAAAPFRYLHIGHLGLSTAFWTPFALLCLDRLLLRPHWRDALLFGLCVAMQALSAQYYGFQIALVVGLYLLYALIWRRSYLLSGPFILRFIAAVVLAEALLLPVVAPYIGVKGAWGYSRGPEENELYSATLTSFLATPPGNLIGGRLAAAARDALGIHSWNGWLYPGYGAVLVALLGLVRRRRPRPAPDTPAAEIEPHDAYPFMLGLALFGAAMALGPALHVQQIDDNELTRLMPYRFFFNVIPAFDAMRAPERFGNVLQLGLGGAAGFGVAALLDRFGRVRRAARRPAWRLALAPALGGLLLAAVGLEYIQAPIEPKAVPPMPPVYGWLAAQPAGPVIELPLGAPPGEPNREQLRQFWSTKHWQTRVNGSSDIVPRSYTALRRDLDLFPDPRTLGILQGLGVRYVVVHRAQYPRLGWEGVEARYASYGVTLQFRAEWPDGDIVYELQPDERFATLRKTIPPDATVFLSGADPGESDAYMAMIGWLLRDNRLISRVVPTFGQRYDRPEPGLFADYAIVYKNEDPAKYGYPAGLPVVYEDNVVRVHHFANRRKG